MWVVDPPAGERVVQTSQIFTITPEWAACHGDIGGNRVEFICRTILGVRRFGDESDDRNPTPIRQTCLRPDWPIQPVPHFTDPHQALRANN
ncbi:hypothetical protein LMG2828_05881 [Achromobacter piechaudii]|nr:hypothetical protein LMG2828_05881 [Achromobacter piechaudii]CAB3955811.1 hypothetical protein LMG6103_04635 [Achromobacter piechaudii]